jgi:3-hydroxyisobutyrate dehydrogenase
MARRLVKAGFAVTGYDVSRARADAAAADGVLIATSPARVAGASEVILSSLPDPFAVRRVYLGEDGVLAEARPGAILADLSTIDPDTWREVAEAARPRDIACLDAPVSGGPMEAASGRLVFLVGGDVAVLDRCRPVLEALSTEIHHMGPLGAGYVVKIVNNVMSLCNVVVAAEAMVLGVRAGVDPQRLFDVLSISGGRSHHFLKRFPNVLAGDFTPHFSVALCRKDLGLALGMAARLGLPMLAASTARQVYEAAAAAGFGAQDMAAVTALYEQWAGVKVRAKSEPVNQSDIETGPGSRRAP